MPVIGRIEVFLASDTTSIPVSSWHAGGLASLVLAAQLLPVTNVIAVAT